MSFLAWSLMDKLQSCHLESQARQIPSATMQMYLWSSFSGKARLTAGLMLLLIDTEIFPSKLEQGWNGKKKSRLARRVIEEKDATLPNQWPNFLALAERRQLAQFLSNALIAVAISEKSGCCWWRFCFWNRRPKLRPYNGYNIAREQSWGGGFQNDSTLPSNRCTEHCGRSSWHRCLGIVGRQLWENVLHDALDESVNNEKTMYVPVYDMRR